MRAVPFFSLQLGRLLNFLYYLKSGIGRIYNDLHPLPIMTGLTLKFDTINTKFFPKFC